MLFEEYALHEGSGGAGEHRGGFGVQLPQSALRRGEARVSFVMDHGRFGPPGAQGGGAGGVNTVRRAQGRRDYVPPHLSKDQDIDIRAGDASRVWTPGGGGFGAPLERAPRWRARDVALGYYTAAGGRGALRRRSRRGAEVDARGHRAIAGAARNTELREVVEDGAAVERALGAAAGGRARRRARAGARGRASCRSSRAARHCP